MPRAQTRRSSRPAGRRRSAHHAGGERCLPGMDARRGVRPTFLRAPTEEPAARVGQRTRRGECPRQLRAPMRAHARSADPAVLAGYMGKSSAFDDALASFAMAYAVRTQKDYDQLAKSKRKAA